MSNLQRSELQSLFGDDELWDIDVGAVVVHNRHIRAWKSLPDEERSLVPREQAGCNYCAGEVATLAPGYEEEEPEAVPEQPVDQSGGADEAKAAPPARTDEAWWQ